MNRRLATLQVLSVALVATHLSAADLIWDTVTGDGTTITNGIGTWQLGVSNWNTAGVDGTWVDGNNAIFGSGTAGTAGTVTLGGAISATKITFNAPSAGLYTVDLNGNTLTTANVLGAVTVLGSTTATISDSGGGGSWNISNTVASFYTVDLTGNLTVSAKVTGTGRMFTGGAGNLTFTNNANDFAGLLGKQNGGVLSISSIANSGVASAAGKGSEVTLGFNAQLTYTGGTASTNRTLSLFGNNATINQNGSGALVWTGAISNTMNASQTFTLSGTNNDLNDLQGSLADGSGVNLTNFTKSGAGTWQLSGSNSFTGTATVSAGTLIANHANALGSTVGSTSVTGNAQLILTGGIAIGTEALTLNSGAASSWNGQSGAALRNYSGNNSWAGAISLGTNTTIAANSGSALAIGGAISGGFNLTKADSGTLTLSGANTYTGTTTIAAGTLQANQVDVASVSGALGNGGAIRFTGGTLQYTANSAGTDYSTRIVSNTTAAIKIDTAGQNVAFGTALANSNTAGLTKEGAGQLELKMSATAQFSGTTAINGGTLKFTGAADLNGISSSSININNGASLVIYSDFNRTTLSNGKTFTFGSTGGGSIVYDKGNHLWQSSAGKFVTTGGTQNTISSANGGFINPQGANTVNFDVADGTNAIDLLVSVVIGNGNYTKSGAGTLSITSFSTLGGGAAQPNLTINAGTFDVGGAARLTTSGQSAGVVTSNILNNGVYRHSSSNSQTLSGIISGTGAVTQNGAGTLTLSGANTYEGSTSANVGTLIVNGDNSGATGTVTVASGATLGGNGKIGGDTTVNGILSTGALATVGSVGTLDFGAKDLTFAENSSWLIDLVQGVTESNDSILVDALTIESNTTLTFNHINSYNGDETYTLATYGSRSGTFSNFMTSGVYTIGGGDYFLNYGTNTITLTAVPEPGTLGLLGLTLGGYFFRRFRKRR